MHLENVSSELLAKHPDIIRKFVGRNSGIYTLYRRERLYYIALAKGLAGRLKAHLRDQQMAARKQTVATGNCGKVLQFFPNGARLRANYKGETFTVRLRKDGTVWFKGTKHASLRSAAMAAIGRPVYSWWFWRAERGKNHWVRLSDFKRAGTAMIQGVSLARLTAMFSIKRRRELEIPL
jgi:hypothetical protein